MSSYAARTWQDTPGAVVTGILLWVTTTALLAAQMFHSPANEDVEPDVRDITWVVLVAHAVCSVLVVIEAFEGEGKIWWLSTCVIATGSLATLFQISIIRQGLVHAAASAAQVAANSVMLALIFRKEALYGSFA
jgi:hypothetical protein